MYNDKEEYLKRAIKGLIKDILEKGPMEKQQ